MPLLPVTNANNHPAPRRILVMRYRFIGDTLLTVPFLRNLRKAYPEATIDMLVSPGSGEILRDCPYIDELLWFDTTRKHRYEGGKAKKQSFWHYVRLLKARKYDAAFVLKRSFSSAALAWLAGIPQRVGFDTEHRGFLLTHRVPYTKDVHEIESFLSVLNAVELPHHDRHLESWWQPQEAEKAQQAIQAANSEDSTPTKQVVLHLTSSNVAKQWPQANALHLLEWLTQHSQVHCLGAAQDLPLYQALQAQLPAQQAQKLHLHCGAFSLTESMAFLSQMDCVVGVDSGTLHMAAAAGVPVVALFGPMDERKWAPINSQILHANVPCRPCNLDSACKHDFVCMKDLQPQTVIETIKSYVGLS